MGGRGQGRQGDQQLKCERKAFVAFRRRCLGITGLMGSLDKRGTRCLRRGSSVAG